MRSHRSGGLKAAMGEAYTRKIALNAAPFRIRNVHGGAGAAATEVY